MSSNNLELVEYSDRSMAIFGDTKLYKEQLRSLGGKFNSSLTFNEVKQAGWIFSKSKYEQLASWIDSCEPDESAPRGNGLLSENGKLTSTAKQFLANEGEKVATLTNKTPVKRTLAKKYRDIELDKGDFKDVKKKLKHHICVDDPAHYANMLPGDKITFYDGEDLRLAKTVLSVLKVINFDHIDGKYDDIIILDKTNDDVEYEVILEF